MGRPKATPTTHVGKLVHEWIGPRTYKQVRDLVEDYLGYSRTEEAIRQACRGGGPELDYYHQGIRNVNNGEPGTLWLVAEALAIPQAEVLDALNRDWLDRLERAKPVIHRRARNGYCEQCRSHLCEQDPRPYVSVLGA